MSVANLEPAPSADEALVDSVRLFARRELDAIKADRACRIEAPILEGLAELGVFGLTLPVEYGGSGCSLKVAARVVQALAEVDRSVATTVGLHLGLGTRALVRYGEAPLKAELIPDLASGQTLAAFGTTEPGAGSDLSRLKTQVFALGDRLTLMGDKSYVTNGGIAGLQKRTRGRTREGMCLRRWNLTSCVWAGVPLAVLAVGQYARAEGTPSAVTTNRPTG